MEDNVLHVISKLPYVKLHVVLKNFFVLYSKNSKLSTPSAPKSGRSRLYRRWSFSVERFQL